jgi:hypothetical protein
MIQHLTMIASMLVVLDSFFGHLQKCCSSFQVCQTVGIFSNQKIPILCKFWRVLQWKMLINCMTNLFIFKVIWYFEWPFGIFLVILYIFPFWHIALMKIWQPCIIFLPRLAIDLITSAVAASSTQSCQIFLGKNTKMGKIYQMTTNATKRP